MLSVDPESRSSKPPLRVIEDPSVSKLPLNRRTLAVTFPEVLVVACALPLRYNEVTETPLLSAVVPPFNSKVVTASAGIKLNGE